MKKIILMSLALMGVAGVEAYSNTQLKNGLPQGSYDETCRNCSFNKTKVLTCTSCQCSSNGRDGSSQKKSVPCYKRKSSVPVPTTYFDIINSYGKLYVISNYVGQRYNSCVKDKNFCTRSYENCDTFCRQWAGYPNTSKKNKK